MSTKQILLYMPVIHAGYERLFETHSDATEILLLGRGFDAIFPSLAKEIRALAPGRVAEYLRTTFRRPHIRVVNLDDLPSAITAEIVVMPDEIIMRELASMHDLGSGRKVIFEKTFLRWDREWSRASRPVDFDGRIELCDLARHFMSLAGSLALNSSDWWRQIGAIAVSDGEVIARAWNQHHPTEYAPYIDGDPRNDHSRGVRADLSTAIHAEASLVAQAAREGLRLSRADLYVTTFPCPACARLVAEAGFQRCFFAGPYSVLDGDRILRAAGVELVWVDMTDSDAANTIENGGC